ncbi:hypothetical protein Rleg4DRAFT_2006 [Rhizobium leguminosarum bv. trifolii WSM2297]|uniref:Uncharacterized protein n=1 Tax=Rhizobium leguminosarum bv. trifolii WSM2297 TaxID=754762 RepID=J0W5D8_RHILT|nr:hypothetical protein Rleg4DRAFT_2006 [Rhizobium leguminosarum bv. trifolii WSM2297]
MIGARSRKTGTGFAAAREAPGDMLVFGVQRRGSRPQPKLLFSASFSWWAFFS